jgi:hypothetical protein
VSRLRGRRSVRSDELSGVGARDFLCVLRGCIYENRRYVLGWIRVRLAKRSRRPVFGNTSDADVMADTRAGIVAGCRIAFKLLCCVASIGGLDDSTACIDCQLPIRSVR